MIPRTHAKLQPPAWQAAMREAVTDPAELLKLLRLDDTLLPGARSAAATFPLRVPRGYVSRMRPGDPADALLLQVLPLGAEERPVAGFGQDAVGDLASLRGDGLLRKYHGRALLISTGACAVHCRYCFRRHFPYDEQNASRHAWRDALEAIHGDLSLEEVILSGGDPLSLSDRRLSELASMLDAVPHLRRLRIHTRTPIVLPERVDDALLGWLAQGRLRRVMVLHANHPREIDPAVQAALTRLKKTGVTLLNQSVLLRGINDNPETLAQLSERLFEGGVMPYYLHQLDRVQGAAHFEVPVHDAAVIMRKLSARLPGYLVPRLVKETSGAPSKLPMHW
jgi:EF-P beta-lysylation protein EpmB